MAVRDIEAFIKERAAQFDSTLDVTSGSPFDTKVIQPLLRRLGTDPFSVDLETFIAARLGQAFPELAIGEGDAITDLLVKPASLLWDPITREITRVRQNLSMKDPTTLTLDEAEALGANLFSERRMGSYAHGMARIFFGQPQNISVSSVNFITAKNGLRYFPTEAQTIRTTEMLLNLADDGTYYFDINIIAESPGNQYNLEASSLISIANVDATVRVTNLRRFEGGENEDSAEGFIDRARGELSERSLVVLRGIAAKLTSAFPEIQRLNVVGLNDPEMQRDVVSGGVLGDIIASGSAGTILDDTEDQATSRRFYTTEEDFTVWIGPTTVDPEGYVLTIVKGIDSLSGPVAYDFTVTRVIDTGTLDVAEQTLAIGRTGLNWTLRKREITLSDIPGGIIFPKGPQGQILIDPGKIHIGGMVDIYVKGSSFDESTLVLSNVTDDVVELSGVEAQPTEDLQNTGSTIIFDGVALNDLQLGQDYEINDSTYRLLERAQRHSLTLQLVSTSLGSSTNLGIYRVIRVLQEIGQVAKLQVEPALAIPGDGKNYTWRLFDKINIDLLDPKETKVTGNDLVSVQNSDIVTAADTNFDEYGVAEDDVLRILEGPIADDYAIKAVQGAGSDQLKLDTALTHSISSLNYIIFRPNLAGGITLPLIRITDIELLDSSNQPLGTKIPYAKPVDIQSRAFQNPARGVKYTLTDVELGIISKASNGGYFTGLGSSSLGIQVLGRDGVIHTGIATFATSSITDVMAGINLAIDTALGTSGSNSVFLYDDSTNSRFAIRPTKAGVILTGATALEKLFGTSEPRTTADIRSATVTNWDALSPIVDYASGLDVVQIKSGNQIGFYPAPYSGPSSTDREFGTPASTALIIRDTDLASDENTRQFAPEDGVRMELGARSLGSVRCYFLEPTSIEFNQDSFFYLDGSTGLIRFVPDPTLDTQIIPPLPSDDKSNDGSSESGTNVFTSDSQNFVRFGVAVGDKLVIDYIPISGTMTFPDPGKVHNVAGTIFVFSIDDGPKLYLTFVQDDISLEADQVTRQGIIDQINAKAGSDIAQLTADYRLEFEADALITIYPLSDNNTASAIILGDVSGITPAVAFEDDTYTNESPHAGSYKITLVNETELQTAGDPFDSADPYDSPIIREGFRIYRTGTQRISTSQMANQKAEAELYYFDVELVSEGTGDLWNIDAKQQLFVDEFLADGYYLTTDDPNLSFSTAEKPKLVISKSILENGVDDDPANATQIAGQNIQITYERSQLVADVQNYITSVTERVVNANLLSRHLLPHFIRFDLIYTGGSQEGVVIPDMESYIRNLLPSDPLESSDIQKIVSDRGANSIRNPIDIIAIVHNIDRTIQAVRSQDSLTTGRLAAFIPDILNIKRNVL